MKKKIIQFIDYRAARNRKIRTKKIGAEQALTPS